MDPLRRVWSIVALGLVLGGALIFAQAACAPDTGINNNKVKHDLSVVDHGDGFIDFIDMARNTTSCVGGGSVCSSSNPGACDKGTVTCDGPLAMCTPDSALQDCYEGPGGTQNVGVCKAGNQSCIGILGPCLGQVLPAAQEDCFNDLDDDCDGKVNNGCPESVGTGTARYVSPLGGFTGNNANEMAVEKKCPQDAFVVRADVGYYDPQLGVSQLILYCSKATLTRNTGTSSYSLGTVAVMPQPYDTFATSSGSLTTGTPTNGACSSTGLQAIVQARGKYDSGGYSGFFTKCGSATATFHSDNTLAIVLNVGAEKGYEYPVSGTAVSWACASNEVLIGFKGTVAPTSIDQIQAICAPLVTKYKL